LIGFFVNTLVLPADLAAAPTFTALLEQVRSTALDAQAHQDVPFEKLVEELEPERHLEHSPLFQVMFTVEDARRADDAAVEGLVIEPLDTEVASAKFELTIQVIDNPEQIELGVQYLARLWDGTTMERFLDHLEVLLEAAVAAPATNPWDLPSMRPAERHQLTTEWGQAVVPYPREATIVELFAEQAAKTPEAVALVSAADYETWSYGDLASRAGALAGRLRALGVGPGEAVAVCAERSPHLIEALLAILEVGAFYLPLAPDYPVERLRFMVEDAGARLLLADIATADRLPALTPAILRLDDAEAAAVPAPAGVPGAPCAEDLAYVAYTSGSTGRPKGVAVPHRAVVRLVRGANYADLGPDQVFLQLAPVSFDAATLEIWGPLLNGGTLVLMPQEPPSPRRIAEVVAEHGVTTLWLTAGLFHLMVDEALDDLRPLRQLLAGGDVLSPDRVRKVLALDGGPRLINGYGPTENTTFTACWSMERQEQVGETVPVGRPVSNTRVHLLDAGRRPVAIGVAGELFAGGDGLATGYLGRPGLTAERFVPDPTGPAGERLYRTGDLARWRPDSSLEFLGRRDFQVKVRGFRIELGEVESALTALPAVQRAVVISRLGKTAGDQRLVAYVVAAEGAADPSPAALRQALTEMLPDYMVPAAFVVLDELPLNANGKVDRGALPAPEDAAVGRPGAFLPPRSQTESLVAEIWAEVLELPRVGLSSDFFELGGHSLLATQVMSRLRSALGVEVPLRELFEGPTVEALARAVDDLAAEASGLVPPPLVPAPRDRQIPLSFAQQRLWFLDQLDPESPAYNMPMPMRAEGPLSIRALEGALSDVVARHEALRTRFLAAGGQPGQVVEAAVPLTVPVIDLASLRQEDRDRLGRELVGRDAMRPFALDSGRLLRCAALRLGAEDHLVLFSMHHIASDGWSMGLLVREVSLLYGHHSTGATAPLEDLRELPVQYADFAAWQRGWLAGEVLEAELGYWRQRLAGAPPVLELPFDRPRPEEPRMLGASVAVELPADLSERLRALCREQRVTPFMALLAAFQAVLARWSGQNDVSVGTPVAGRNRLEVENLIGFFVNTLVLRTQLEAETSFAELLVQVRDHALEAQRHQELPFERLVEELQPDRSLNHTPLFQVMFGLHNARGGELDVEGLRLSPVDGDESVAKFDLHLAMEESDETFEGTLEYAAELFDPTTARRLTRHLVQLVASAVESPDGRVSDLALLDGAERHQLTVEWTSARRAYPRGASIPELLALQVARTPEAVAIVAADDGETLTYADLAREARALARGLCDLGVRRGDAVALAAERSPRLVVALLAILEAGGFYVPLAPEYPQERLRFMIEDSAAKVLVAERHLVDRLPSDGLSVVFLERAEAVSAAPPEATGHGSSEPLRLDGSDLAYVAYTSGSTGRPKGVAVPHRAVARLVLGT
ncbi:MAG: amino acid adenylation domain-containing protein, partial [Acidobacteria bacterium]|nr:amino acid adenylation domain-containing protein [Acidobacteriota bacterium]